MEKIKPAIPDPNLNHSDINRHSENVLDGLLEYGYFHLQEPLLEIDFQKISTTLGHIMSRSELKLDPEKDAAQEKQRNYDKKEHKRPSIYKHLGLDFHNDNPRGNRISWYCIRQDEELGALWLIDSKRLFAKFTKEEKDILTTIKLRYIEVINGKEHHPWESLLTRSGELEEIYFGSWHLKATYDPQQLKMIDKFKNILQNEKEEGLISVRLQPGQSIYVNNRRMLHARGPISENSRRHIIRLAINSDSTI